MTSERAVLEQIAEGTEPDRVGQYAALRDWVHRTATAALAATPAPREDGWEELRREIEALPGYLGPVNLVDRRDVLAIVDRLAAARGEPPEDHPFKDEWAFQRSMLKPYPGNAAAGQPIAPDQPCFTCGEPFSEHRAARGEPGLEPEPDRLREALALAHSMLHSGEQPTRQSEDIMHAALLASPAPDPGAELDAAWAEAEAALPEGWDISWLGHSGHGTQGRDWAAHAQGPTRSKSVYGDMNKRTPAEALLSLAATLRQRAADKAAALAPSAEPPETA